jgi:hypothetical protein
MISVNKHSLLVTINMHFLYSESRDIWIKCVSFALEHSSVQCCTYWYTNNIKVHLCTEQGGKVARIRRYFYTCPLDYAKWATLCGRLNSSWAGCSNGGPLEEEEVMYWTCLWHSTPCMRMTPWGHTLETNLNTQIIIPLSPVIIL